MARLKRVTNKIFGSTASTLDNETTGPEIGQFGSAKLGTYYATSDVATIQGLSAYEKGWIEGVIPDQQYPTLPEMTGVNKVLSYQTGYLMQEGVAEWDANTEYHKNSIVKYATSTSSTSVTASIGDSTGITDATVNGTTFLSQISVDGEYRFVYNGSDWTYNALVTNLTLYGITVTGTAVEDDEIIVTVDTVVTPIEKGELYYSLDNNNLGNLPTDTTKWAEFYMLPVQTGNNGKYLTTDGTSPSWATVDALPSQTGHSGEILTTDGSSASWTTLNASNKQLSNLDTQGNNRLHALKGYEDNGELLTDSEGLADVKEYAHSTFDADKFEVVNTSTLAGTLVITDDGIASGFSTSNYITSNTSIPFTTAQNVTLKFRIYINSSSNNQVFFNFGAIAGASYGGVDTSGNLMGFLTLDSGQTITLNNTYDFIVNINLVNKTKIVGFKLSTSTNYTYTNAQDCTSRIPATDTIVYLGVQGSYGNFPLTNGSFDLKQFSITVDGVSVFSGNKTGTDTYTISGSSVVIPYTLSKTGSKIVDSYYRTEVTAVYNEFGYAPYYTLSDSDFTLPMGEIYGMHVNKGELTEVNPMITSYVNGTSGYNIWANGYCEQWGYVATINSTVALVKTYADTNYNIVAGSYTHEVTCGYVPRVRDITISSFAFSQDSFSATGTLSVYWKTSGYLADGEY